MFNYFVQKFKSDGFGRFLRFSLVGVIGTGVNYLFLFIFYSLFHFHYLLAAAVAFEFGVISNFIFNNKWTFKDRRKSNENIFLRFFNFNLVSLGGMAINLLIIFILKGHFNFNLYIANLFAILCAWFWNFFVNNFWTWGKSSDKNNK